MESITGAFLEFPAWPSRLATLSNLQTLDNLANLVDNLTFQGLLMLRKARLKILETLLIRRSFKCQRYPFKVFLTLCTMLA